MTSPLWIPLPDLGSPDLLLWRVCNVSPSLRAYLILPPHCLPNQQAASLPRLSHDPFKKLEKQRITNQLSGHPENTLSGAVFNLFLREMPPTFSLLTSCHRNISASASGHCLQLNLTAEIIVNTQRDSVMLVAFLAFANLQQMTWQREVDQHRTRFSSSYQHQTNWNPVNELRKNNTNFVCSLSRCRGPSLGTFCNFELDAKKQEQSIARFNNPKQEIMWLFNTNQAVFVYCLSFIYHFIYLWLPESESHTDGNSNSTNARSLQGRATANEIIRAKAFGRLAHMLTAVSVVQACNTIYRLQTDL